MNGQEADPVTGNERCPKCGRALAALPAPMTMARTPAAPSYRCTYCGSIGDELDRRTETSDATPQASDTDEDRS
jgi:hypothetical protein